MTAARWSDKRNLTDETSTGVESRVSPRFLNKLIAHPNFQKFFLNTPAALQLLTQARSQVAGQFMRTFDTQAGLVLKEYRAKVTTWSGNTARLVADGQGHAYPTGTIDTAFTHAAPPLDMDELDGVADVADLIHMTTERMKHNRGEEWAYQMNALPLWARPKTLGLAMSELALEMVGKLRSDVERSGLGNASRIKTAAWRHDAFCSRVAAMSVDSTITWPAPG